jgi:hypothetical protein
MNNTIACSSCYGTGITADGSTCSYCGINRKIIPRVAPIESFLWGELRSLQDLVAQLHKAKGRYNTQIATCDLFDAVGLSNVRPVREMK